MFFIYWTPLNANQVADVYQKNIVALCVVLIAAVSSSSTLDAMGSSISHTFVNQEKRVIYTQALQKFRNSFSGTVNLDYEGADQVFQQLSDEMLLMRCVF